MTYKEFLKTLNKDESDKTKDEIGLILYYRNLVLSVLTDSHWTIPRERMNILETKDQGASRLFRQLFDLDINESKLNLVTTKFNSNRGKLYLYTYQCKSNYMTDEYVTNTYLDSDWKPTDDLPRPFCKDITQYIN